MPTAVRVDRKGRVLLPKKDRELLGIVPGDLLFLRREQSEFRLVRAENPFDALAAEALQENRERKTIPIEDVARRWGLDIEELREEAHRELGR